MGKVAFVFAGQGAQYSGMGKELCEKSPAAQAVFDVADKLRPGTREQCFAAPVEELSITKNTQPWRRPVCGRTWRRASLWGKSPP